MSGPDIFISYCRQERPLARLFAEAFAEEGLKVWWDAVLHSGETFDEVIERNLRAAKSVVVLWSPQSVTSRWVRAEATQADRANKLVPVIIEPCNLPIIFELTHTTDLTGWQGDRTDHRWRTLIDDLRRFVGPAQDAVPIQASEPEQAIEPKPATAVEIPASRPVAAPKPVEPAMRDTDALAANPDELAKALERLASKQESELAKPTPVEEVFSRSDEFRRTESEAVHCLRRIHADESDAYYVVTASGLKIGRTAPADLIVAEPGVSREHCVVELSADKLRVLDLNSTNGTYIDNKRIGRAEILAVGSVLRIGNASFEHAVRSRAELQLQDDMMGFDPDTDRPEPRIARSS